MSPAAADRAGLKAAWIAVRSGAVLMVYGVALLTVSLLLNAAGTRAERIDVPPVGALLLVGAGAWTVGIWLTVARSRAVRHRLTAHLIANVLWLWTVGASLALAAGVLLVPETTMQIALLYVVIVVYAGYFFSGPRAATAIGFAVACLVSAVAFAPTPEISVDPWSPAAALPVIGAMAILAWLVGSVRKEREELEERTRLGAVIGLAHALDLRDAGTADHSGTVAGFAVQMATELGLPPQRVERVRLAGLVHDVGKIGIPDAVLLKPAKLTDGEWEQMRRHPELGARMLDSELLDDIRGWVLAHHERPDGRGYPLGLRGDDIPLEARILSVADAYEAMIADRVYRAGMPPEAARAELRRCAGTQFDETVVTAFLRLLDIAEPARPLAEEAA